MHDSNDQYGSSSYSNRGRGGQNRHGGRGRQGGHHGHAGGHAGGHGGGHAGGHGGGEFRRDTRRGLPLSELNPELTEVSRKVIGCAIEVHKELGPGYPREFYLKALEMELDAEEIDFVRDASFDVEFDEEVIGQVSVDFYIDDRFLLSVLARTGEVGGGERSELRAKLRSADLELGLIINFGERRLKDGLVRVLNPDKLNLNRDHDGDDDEYEDEDHDSAKPTATVAGAGDDA